MNKNPTLSILLIFVSPDSCHFLVLWSSVA